MIGRTGFWMRVLATAIDLFILMVFAVIVGIILVPDANAIRGEDVRSWYLLTVLVACFWLLLTLFEIFLAATPGKMILRRSIANANGTEASTATLCLRWFAKNLPVLLILMAEITLNQGFRVMAGISNGIVAVGCLMALNEMKQTWHDQWAGTAVFRNREVLEAPAAVQRVRGVAPPT